MIPRNFIDDVLARTDIVKVVGEHVQLKRGGADYKGRCPFHGAKGSNAFTVSPSKGFYHCFRCGASGTAIDFLMNHLNLEFVEAVEELAGRLNLQVPNEQRPGGGAAAGGRRSTQPVPRALPDETREAPATDGRPPEPPPQLRPEIPAHDARVPSDARVPDAAPPDARESDKSDRDHSRSPAPGGMQADDGPTSRFSKTTLLARLSRADAHFQQQLRLSDAAKDYCRRRGLDGRTAKAFGLGFAPDEWHALKACFDDYDAAQDELIDSGLVLRNERSRYDRFRGRLMFPIRDLRGRVVGFGGRVLDGGEPKYLNSPETVVFHKGHELYGLFESVKAIRRQRMAVVVEGYMDVVMLHQHGANYCVATLGTATTEWHLAKLMRIVDRIVFCFDGDEAGRGAAWRALERALPVMSDTLALEFLFLPEEHDPDSFVRERGLAAFEAALRSALPLSQFLITQLKRRSPLVSAEGRARFQADMKPLLKLMPDIALRTQIAREAAEAVDVDEQEFRRFAGLPAAPAVRERMWSGRPREWRGGRDSGGPLPPMGRPSRVPSVVEQLSLMIAMHPGLATMPLAPPLDESLLPEPFIAWRQRAEDLDESGRLAGTLEERLEQLKQGGDDGLRPPTLGPAVMRWHTLFATMRDSAQWTAAFQAMLRQACLNRLAEMKGALAATGLETEEDRAKYSAWTVREREIHDMERDADSVTTPPSTG